jgi:hypothetical protein
VLTVNRLKDHPHRPSANGTNNLKASLEGLREFEGHPQGSGSKARREKAGDFTAKLDLAIVVIRSQRLK